MQTIAERSPGGVKPVPVMGPVALLLLLSAVAALLRYVYLLPLTDTVLWYAGVIVFFSVPGSLVLRWVGFSREEFFVRAVHGTAVGAFLVPVLYGLLRAAEAPWLLPVLAGAACVLWAVLAWRDRKADATSPASSAGDVAAILALVGFACVVLHLSHFTDVVFLDGEEYKARVMNESFFHVALVNVLRHTYPPFYPFLSGHDFSHYHLNMHLQMECLNRFLGLDTIRLAFFYMPFLYVTLLVTVPYVLVRRILGRRILGVVTGVLMMGSDLSFIPGVLGLYAAGTAWFGMFHPTTVNLVMLNGFLPASALFSLCLMYLMEYFRHGRGHHLVVLALLVYTAYGFKSSLGLQFAGIALVTAAAARIMGADGVRSRRLAVTFLLVALAIAADLVFLRGGANRTILFAPFNAFESSLGALGLSDIHPAFLVAAYPLYALASFGARALGLVVVGAMMGRDRFDPGLFFLLAFCLSGFLLTEFVVIPSPNSAMNQAYFFALQSLMAAWLLLPFAAVRRGLAGWKLAAAVVAVVLLAAPSTVQLLRHKYRPPYFSVGRDELAVVRYLEGTPPYAVVLHPASPRRPSLAAHLAGRQAVMSRYFAFLADWVSMEELKTRAGAISDFFAREPQVDRSSVLRRYDVDFVYVTRDQARLLDDERLLSPVLENGTYVLFAVKPAVMR